MKNIRELLILLLIALAHGFVYIFLVPPWQHYDEPNHFEYVWLAANMDRLPKPGDYDPKMSRQVLKSMVANGFYDQMGSPPVIGPPQIKVHIPGYGQLSEPPLYYLAASLPLRLLQSRSIDAQLVAARFVSLMFYLLTVVCAWGIAGELAPSHHPLRWMLPLTVVMLPGFTDLMTAVNNDAAAVAVFSLFLWGSVRLIRKGFSTLDFTWVVIAATLAYFAKNTALISWLLFPVTILFSLMRGKIRFLAWIILFACLALVLATGISWGDAATWYRANSQIQNTRCQSEKAVLGDHAFLLDPQARVTPVWLPPLFQPLPARNSWSLWGSTVTLGAWMWAENPVEISTPVLNTPSMSVSQPVRIGPDPTFFAFHVTLPANDRRIWVAMPKLPADVEETVFFDGMVLAEGERPLDQAPNFADAEGKSGVWGGQPFVNLLRNPSAERAGPRIRLFMDDLSTKVLPVNTRLSLVLTSFLDWSASGDFYQISARHLFQTFWARFGWGHVPLLGESTSYWALALFSLIALFGCIVGLIRRTEGVPWDLIAFMGIGLIGSWGAALARGSVSLAQAEQYVPVARHAYPVIIPVALFLCLGWLEVFSIFNSLTDRGSKVESSQDRSQIGNHSNIAQVYQLVIYFSLFLILDVISLFSVARFFGKL